MTSRKFQPIYLTGISVTGYTVKTGGLDGLADIPVPTMRIGHAIVRALRELAEKGSVASPKTRRNP